MSEQVKRHRFTEWVTDSLGESRSRSFAPEEVVLAFGFDPGGSKEPFSGPDTPVASAPILYFTKAVLAPSPHDEWTVRGLRYEQDGEAAEWISPWTGRLAGVVITLHRRTG